jgi:hypothetical protein
MLIGQKSVRFDHAEQALAPYKLLSPYAIARCSNWCCQLLQVRMPSGMVGQKSTLFEGGIRNFLAVQGPGIPAGVTDSTLLSVTDILPTLSDLAGVKPGSIPHAPWDGISFTNVLFGKHNTTSSTSGATTSGGNGRGSGGNRSSSNMVMTQQLQQQQQQERMVIVLGPYCWDADTVPATHNITRWAADWTWPALMKQQQQYEACSHSQCAQGFACASVLDDKPATAPVKCSRPAAIRPESESPARQCLIASVNTGVLRQVNGAAVALQRNHGIVRVTL